MSWERMNVFKNVIYSCRETDFRIFDDWANGKNLVTFISNVNGNDLPRLISTGRQNSTDPNTIENTPNKYLGHHYADHCETFKNNHGKVWVTYQPYCSSKEAYDVFSEWCDDNNLHLKVYEKSKSWYKPGSTCLVVITD